MNVFTFSLVELMFAVFSPPIFIGADDSANAYKYQCSLTTQPFAINQYHSSTQSVELYLYSTIRIPSVITKGKFETTTQGNRFGRKGRVD